MRLLLLMLVSADHLFISTTQVSAEPESCRTYRETKGTCVNIKQCPFLLNLLKRRDSRQSLSSSTLFVLNRSQCGFEGLDPKVCCNSELSEHEEEAPPPQSHGYSTASFSNMISDSSKRSACKTANGSDGTCMIVNQCPSLHSVLITQQSTISESALKILKQSLCGFEKMIPKVCCSDDQRLAIIESTTLSSQSDRIIFEDSIPEKLCITNRGVYGTCVNIKRCRSLFELVKRSNHQLSYEASQTLKKVHCGFENMDPKVCCENEKLSGSTTSPDQSLVDKKPIDPTPPDVTNHPSLRLLDHDLCGPIHEAKIIGGTKTAVFEFPWMALIAYDTGSEFPEFRCGGSLITKKHVLTAAHCIVKLPSSLRLAGVRLGEHDLSRERDCDIDINGLDINCAADYQDFSILGIAVYPDYPKDKHQDDIGLIMLDGEANFLAANVRPICLPLSSSSVLNPKMTVTGWGATETGPRSQTLRKVTLPIVPHQDCVKLYKMRNIKIWHKQICAGGSNRTDSCSGDSGGPLQTQGMYNGSPRYIIYGIVSFGPRDCGSKHIPGVYTSVEYYMDWILDTIGTDIYDD